MSKLNGVGDITSDAKGSGARFNTGKPSVDLVPLTLIATSWANDVDPLPGLIMLSLGGYQETGDAQYLYNAIQDMGAPWEDCARVFEYGKAKYAAWNWAKGMAWSIPLACAARHVMALRRNEMNDLESGLPHYGHVMCNIAMLLTFTHSYKEGNDLPLNKLQTGLA